MALMDIQFVKYWMKRLCFTAVFVVATACSAPNAAAQVEQCGAVGEQHEFCVTERRFIYIPFDANLVKNVEKTTGVKVPKSQVGVLSATPAPKDKNKLFSTEFHVFENSQVLSDTAFVNKWSTTQIGTSDTKFFDQKQRLLGRPGDQTLYISFFRQTISANPKHQPRPIHVETFITQSHDPVTGSVIVLKSLFVDAAAMRFMSVGKPGETLKDYRNDFATSRATQKLLLKRIRRTSND